MRALVAASAAGVIALGGASAQAFCPSYSASSSSNTHGCLVDAVPGTNPTLAEWQDIFDVVSKGPAAWGEHGPEIGNIGQGCGKPEPLESVPPRFPCELLKAIAMAESGWRQFCVPDRPEDQKGGASRTIIAFDCGYGVGQVTSGMREKDPAPNYDRQRVASDPLYNLATGTQILAAKWRATNCVGDNQPSKIEHWYAATWAYNGLAYVNNPANPVYDANRGVYNPSVNTPAPYQEKVFGRIEHPTSPDHWASIELAYPNPGDVGTTGKPPALPEPTCASPTDCVNLRASHLSFCLGGDPDPEDPGSGGQGGAGGGTIGVDDGGIGELPGRPPGSGDGRDTRDDWPSRGRGSERSSEMSSDAYVVSCSCELPGGRKSSERGPIAAFLAGLALVTLRRASSSPR